MPNPVTGDFEAVLQVSGGTINRLMASMHQNVTKPGLPSFPHSLQMRIGDIHGIDRVRGSAQVQVSVPRIELIHGVSDRFILEVGVRAWYKPDAGSAPFPAFIHGAVRAEYRIHDIDPGCRGWSKLAADYLWIRVVKDSVQFQGTADEDRSPFEIGLGGATEAENIAKITKQIAHLLATRFEATPHPVSNRFKRGMLRSLNAPIGGSAVALPMGLSGDPAGDIGSINNVLLQGSDLAVGINIDFIMSLATPALDTINSFNGTTVPVGDFTVYKVGVHPPKLEWQPHGFYGVFNIKVSGWAKTRSVLADATFTVEVNISLNFDGGGRTTVALGGFTRRGRERGWHRQRNGCAPGEGCICQRLSTVAKTRNP